MNLSDIFSRLSESTFYEIDSDESLHKDDRFRMRERNKQYSEILQAYAENVKRVLLIKFIFRIIFLAVSILSLIGIFVVFCVILWLVIKSKVEIGYMEAITSIISSMVALITVFIVLPKIMTKYLFDTEEEKNVYSIVKQIQDYDKVIRENLK